jgi:hypothetical protein
MPGRRIPKSYCSLTGQVASTKRVASGLNGGMAAFESSLERDLLILLDFDPEVLCYEEQPVRIDYVDAGGCRRRYTPDVLVRWRRDGVSASGMRPLPAEVKYGATLRKDWADLKPRFRAARLEARARGWRFRILTEVEVRTPHLRNAKFLSPSRRLARDGASVNSILTALHQLRESDPEMLLGTLARDLRKRAGLIPRLWHLVATRKVGLDLSLPRTMRSRLWSLDLERGGDDVSANSPTLRQRLAGRTRGAQR